MVKLAALFCSVLRASLRMKLYKLRVDSMNMKAESLNIKLHSRLKTRMFLAHELLISLFLSCGSQGRRKCRITRKVINIRPLSLNCASENSWYVAVYGSGGSSDATCATENSEEIHAI